ncbi:hypothetical protein [Streptomyces sp. SID1034]|nr:hypothetical protein [Streptomyces sp. SID1034]MYV93861.1 hypothetical protein [Streptomyces sp. SID1034]
MANAQANGWTCVIVTNGRTVQQEAKIRHAELAPWSGRVEVVASNLP